MQKLILNITPQTHVRATQGDRIYFRIPREKLRPAGLKRLERLEKYNQYKIDLLALALQQKFRPPEQGGHILFYIPVPKTWKKYKKENMHMRLHQSRPDVDNLLKAFLDSLMPEDKYIADIRITKKWINAELGYIEVLTSLPIFQSDDVLL
jgi:Holliday junction resolvase RusA-like endonuclease